MKKSLLAACLSIIVAGTVMTAPALAAEKVAVSMARFDDNFLTLLKNGISDYAKGMKDVSVQIEDATDDVGKQLNQIQNFIASGVDAIIVNAVDTDATTAMSKAAKEAGIPLVYVNREPINVDKLPDNQAFVASNEVHSGSIETFHICAKLGGKGNIVVLVGQLSNQAAVQRTQDIKDVLKLPMCSGMKIVEEQSAEWSRVKAQDIMTNWLSAGVKFDAVIANNDEMAIGAIQAMKSAGMSMKDVMVGGVDATEDALAAMKAGDLDVTVFQNASAQGTGALDAALALARGESVDQKVYIPFEEVNPDNLERYIGAN